jgi:hypothetical protein
VGDEEPFSRVPRSGLRSWWTLFRSEHLMEHKLVLNGVRQGRAALRQPCRFCARLTEKEGCPEYLQHNNTYGHFPKEMRWQQAPGQPRVLTRFCGKWGRELLSS